MQSAVVAQSLLCPVALEAILLAIEWHSFIAWRLVLNPSKCKSFCITLRRNPIIHRYAIEGRALEKSRDVKFEPASPVPGPKSGPAGLLRDMSPMLPG